MYMNLNLNIFLVVLTVIKDGIWLISNLQELMVITLQMDNVRYQENYPVVKDGKLIVKPKMHLLVLVSG